MIPWDDIKGDYSDLFPSGTGNVAKPARVAFGALVIKDTLGLTDEETVEQIRENPYLQYFLGFRKFSYEKPFDSSLMVRFRQRFGKERLNEINETMFGVYPESVHVDMIYRNRGNIRYCHERGIRISGPRLGRPPIEPDPAVIKQARQDARDRNCSEGKFGEGKRRYGLNLIKAKLQETSETVIIMNLIVMNLARLHRGLFVLFQRAFFALSGRKCCCKRAGFCRWQLRFLKQRACAGSPR